MRPVGTVRLTRPLVQCSSNSREVPSHEINEACDCGVHCGSAAEGISALLVARTQHAQQATEVGRVGHARGRGRVRARSTLPHARTVKRFANMRAFVAGTAIRAHAPRNEGASAHFVEDIAEACDRQSNTDEVIDYRRGYAIWRRRNFDPVP